MNYVILQRPNLMYREQPFIIDSTTEIVHDEYVPVYSGVIDVNEPGEDRMAVCDDLFRKFNIDHPHDYTSRSLSAGDLIHLHDDGLGEYYLCCSIGWHKVRAWQMR